MEILSVGDIKEILG